MKYIKKYESVKKFHKGDYVVIKDTPLVLSDDFRRYGITHSGKIYEFFNSEIIGIIWTDIDNYSELPNIVTQYVSADDIEFSSKNKEECETYLMSKKYNL